MVRVESDWIGLEWMRGLTRFDSGFRFDLGLDLKRLMRGLTRLMVETLDLAAVNNCVWRCCLSSKWV